MGSDSIVMRSKKAMPRLGSTKQDSHFNGSDWVLGIQLAHSATKITIFYGIIPVCDKSKNFVTPK